MRRIVVGFGLAVGLLLLGATPAFADTMPTPGGGSAFDQHVAAMAPGHDGMTGAAFGGCVSSMASQGVCNCSCPCPMP